MEKKTYILPYSQLLLYHLHVALGMAREIRFLMTVVVWYHICNICSTPHLHINVLAFFCSCSLLRLMLRALYLFGRVRSFSFLFLALALLFLSCFSCSLFKVKGWLFWKCSRTQIHSLLMPLEVSFIANECEQAEYILKYGLLSSLVFFFVFSITHSRLQHAFLFYLTTLFRRCDVWCWQTHREDV